MWFLNDCDGNRVLWLKPDQEYTIGKRNKNLKTTDPSMSRTHAVLSCCGTSVIVKDSNSTHGTWVKKSNSDFKREKQISLEHNDQVRFGLLTVYTVVYREMIVSFSSISSHDMIKLNQLSSRYNLVLKKELMHESICLICGGNVFSAKKALALVLQVPVVSLEWLHVWDDVDPYSFKIPEFDSYLPDGFKVKTEILEKDLWKTNSKRKVMFKGLEFILSGNKQNLDMTKNVITAAGGTASILNVTQSTTSSIKKGVILVCESDMIDWIKAEKLNIRAFTQDDLGVAIMKGVLELDDHIRQTRSIIPKASLRDLGSLDLFDDQPFSGNGQVNQNKKQKLQAGPMQQNQAVSTVTDVKSKSATSIDVFNLFDDPSSNISINEDVTAHKVSAPRKVTLTDNAHPIKTIEKSNLKAISTAPNKFDLFNDDLLGDSRKAQDGKISVTDSTIQKAGLPTSLTNQSTFIPLKQNTNQTNKRSKKRIDIDSFFDSLLNVDEDLQSQDPSVRDNSIEDSSIKQQDAIESPLKTVKMEKGAPIGTLKGKTTSLAERLGLQPLPKDEIIPSSLSPVQNYTAEPFISEGSDVIDIVVPATPVKPPVTATVPKHIVQKSPMSSITEEKHKKTKAPSSVRNQQLINQALERERAGIVKTEDMDMVDSSRSYCRIIFSDSLIVKKPTDLPRAMPVASGTNAKRFVSNQAQRRVLLAQKPPPVEMVPHYRTIDNDNMIGKNQSRMRNVKKRSWPGFSSDEENE